MKKLITASLGLLLIFLISSCGPTSYTVSTRPTYTYTRPVSPGAGYVWIEGDWYWSNGNYIHRDGYWGRPRGHRVYHEGNWVQHRNGWYWRKGKWHR